MDNALLFEHLINDKVSKSLRWADLYRDASAVINGCHNERKVGKIEISMTMALYKLEEELTGEKLAIVKQQADRLTGNATFDTIDDIIDILSANNIIF